MDSVEKAINLLSKNGFKVRPDGKLYIYRWSLISGGHSYAVRKYYPLRGFWCEWSEIDIKNIKWNNPKKEKESPPGE